MVDEKKYSMTHTKKEILDAYNKLKKQIEEKSKLELKPEKKIEEKKEKEVVQVAESLSSEGAVRSIDNLKIEAGKMLSQLSEKLESATNKYNDIKKAIEVRETELKEIYEIEKSAHSLAALIEAQRQKREDFELEMETEEKELTENISNTRLQWEKEKKTHLEESRAMEAEEKKKREREKEEYKYTFEREKELATNKYDDEKSELEKEIILKREEFEKMIADREKDTEERGKVVSEREKKIDELQDKVDKFPKELDITVDKVIKETTEKIQTEAKNRELLLKKEYDGEKNVFLSKIEALEKMVSDQNDQIEKLSAQMEKSYQKVQDIAMKSIEGTSNTKILGRIEQLITEKNKKQSSD